MADDQPIAELRAMTAERDRLRAALEPFAEAAKSGVVKDALSFGEPPAVLYLTRGFGSITISAHAFKTARAALAATPPPNDIKNAPEIAEERP